MVQVAVLGYGTVGSGVVEVLESNKSLISVRAGEEVNVKYILDLRDFPGDPYESKVVHDVNVILEDPEVKIICETMGGIEPAYTFSKKAIMAGKSVCTSNKELVAAHGPELLKLAKEKKVPIHTNSKVIEKISNKGNVYLMARFEKYIQNLEKDKNHVLLVNPSDMGNLGTIIRVMLGFGYKNLAIITPCIDHFDPKVIRASMGSIFNVNIQLFSTIEEYTEEYKNALYPFMLKAKTTLQEIENKITPHTLIFGNEAHGLPDNYLNIGTPILIQHSKDIDSLNLSMSVGIALYEFSK